MINSMRLLLVLILIVYCISFHIPVSQCYSLKLPYHNSYSSISYKASSSFLRMNDNSDLRSSSSSSSSSDNNSKNNGEFDPFNFKVSSATIQQDSKKNTNPGKLPSPKNIILKIRQFFIIILLFVRGLYTSMLTIIKTKFIPKRIKTMIENNPKEITKIQKILPKMISIFILLVSLQRYNSYTSKKTIELAYSSFLKLIENDPKRIEYLRITSSAFFYKIDGKAAFTRRVILDPLMLGRLAESGLEFSAPANPPNVFGILWTLVYAGFMWNITTRMMSGPQDKNVGNRKDLLMEKTSLSFDDIAGQDQAKLEVNEVCNMLKNPSYYQAVGARLPAGVLLIGPPGTGKTLLARITAAEAKVPFYSCSASDFVEVFVGRGPARVRKLFQNAATTAPCIIFIDELDSIGRSRRQGSMNSEQENTLNQLLTCMDGLDTNNNGVIVMAATNRLELLDPALLRSGRFDRIIQCPLPDKGGREAILNVHCKKLNVSGDVDLERIAKLTPGTSGADLCTITNEAAIRTARRGGAIINNMDFDSAIENYFSGRGIQFNSLLEVAQTNLLPNWLGGGGNNKDGSNVAL